MSVIEDDKLPDAEVLKDILNYIGATYPETTLKRRIGLLSETERDRCDKAWEKVMKNLDKIDEIIAERAEKENDQWP